MKVFGVVPWAVRLPSVLLSALAVLLLFSLAKQLASRSTAFWAAMLFAIQGHLIELASGRTSNDHPDTFLMVFVLAAIWAAGRMAAFDDMRYAIISGFFTGLAFLSKSWPALLAIPVAFLLLYATRRYSLRRILLLHGAMLLAAACVALPWSIYALLEFPEETAAASTGHWKHFTENIESHGRPWTYFWSQLPMIHGELVVIALIWFLLVPFRKNPHTHAVLLLWWLLPYIVFSLARTKMPAYTVTAVPALCIIIAMAIDRWSSLPKEDRWRIPAFVGGAMLIVLPLRFSLDRTRPFAATVPHYTTPNALLVASPRTVLVNCPFPIETMFHTPIAGAYQGPLATEVGTLTQLGYIIVDWPRPAQ